MGGNSEDGKQDLARHRQCDWLASLLGIQKQAVFQLV